MTRHTKHDTRPPSPDPSNVSRQPSSPSPSSNDKRPSTKRQSAYLLSVLGPGNYQRLSDATSLTRPHVSRILRGIVDPSPDALEKIAAATSLSIADITTFIANYKERRDLPDNPPNPRSSSRPQINGAALRQARIGLGYTQDDVATLAGIDHTYVSQIEGGRTPSDDVLSRVVAVLDLEVDDVVIQQTSQQTSQQAQTGS